MQKLLHLPNEPLDFLNVRRRKRRVHQLIKPRILVGRIGRPRILQRPRNAQYLRRRRPIRRPPRPNPAPAQIPRPPHIPQRPILRLLNLHLHPYRLKIRLNRVNHPLKLRNPPKRIPRHLDPQRVILIVPSLRQQPPRQLRVIRIRTQLRIIPAFLGVTPHRVQRSAAPPQENKLQNRVPVNRLVQRLPHPLVLKGIALLPLLEKVRPHQVRPFLIENVEPVLRQRRNPLPAGVDNIRLSRLQHRNPGSLLRNPQKSNRLILRDAAPEVRPVYGIHPHRRPQHLLPETIRPAPNRRLRKLLLPHQLIMRLRYHHPLRAAHPGEYPRRKQAQSMALDDKGIVIRRLIGFPQRRQLPDKSVLCVLLHHLQRAEHHIRRRYLRPVMELHPLPQVNRMHLPVRRHRPIIRQPRILAERPLRVRPDDHIVHRRIDILPAGVNVARLGMNPVAPQRSISNPQMPLRHRCRLRSRCRRRRRHQNLVHLPHHLHLPYHFHHLPLPRHRHLHHFPLPGHLHLPHHFHLHRHLSDHLHLPHHLLRRRRPASRRQRHHQQHRQCRPNMAMDTQSFRNHTNPSPKRAFRPCRRPISPSRRWKLCRL